MESNSSKVCAICKQIKPANQFPALNRHTEPHDPIYICFACQTTTFSGSDDEGGSGGKQLQHRRDPRQIQYELELEAALLKDRENQNRLLHERNIFGASQLFEHEKKEQADQRELLDLKEAPPSEEDDEPNPDLALDAQAKRQKIVRLFSVTRSLARDYVATNNSKATVQKNLGLFAQMKDHKAIINGKQAKISTEASTLFAQHTKESIISDAEKLAHAIREGQKIFKK